MMTAANAAGVIGDEPDEDCPHLRRRRTTDPSLEGSPRQSSEVGEPIPTEGSTLKLPQPDNDTGSWFPVPTDDELPENLRKLFTKAREQLGFVPNVFRVWAYRPERVSAWFAHYRQLHEPTDASRRR